MEWIDWGNTIALGWIICSLINLVASCLICDSIEEDIGPIFGVFILGPVTYVFIILALGVESIIDIIKKRKNKKKLHEAEAILIQTRAMELAAEEHGKMIRQLKEDNIKKQFEDFEKKYKEKI